MKEADDNSMSSEDEEKNIHNMSFEEEEKERKRIEKLLKDVHGIKIPRNASPKRSRKQKIDWIKSINAYLAERLDCFVVFGFDTNGNEVILLNANNPLEKRALNTLFEDVGDVLLPPLFDSEKQGSDDIEDEDDD